MSKKRPRQCCIYTSSWYTAYIRRGLCLLYMTGIPEPQLNNSKVPTPSFCYNPCPGSGWGGDNKFYVFISLHQYAGVAGYPQREPYLFLGYSI